MKSSTDVRYYEIYLITPEFVNVLIERFILLSLWMITLENVIYVPCMDKVALLLQFYHIEKWKSDITRKVVGSMLQSAVDKML